MGMAINVPQWIIDLDSGALHSRLVMSQGRHCLWKDIYKVCIVKEKVRNGKIKTT